MDNRFTRDSSHSDASRVRDEGAVDRFPSTMPVDFKERERLSGSMLAPDIPITQSGNVNSDSKQVLRPQSAQRRRPSLTPSLDKIPENKAIAKVVTSQGPKIVTVGDSIQSLELTSADIESISTTCFDSRMSLASSAILLDCLLSYPNRYNKAHSKQSDNFDIMDMADAKSKGKSSYDDGDKDGYGGGYSLSRNNSVGSTSSTNSNVTANTAYTISENHNEFDNRGLNLAPVAESQEYNNKVTEFDIDRIGMRKRSGSRSNLMLDQNLNDRAAVSDNSDTENKRENQESFIHPLGYMSPAEDKRSNLLESTPPHVARHHRQGHTLGLGTSQGPPWGLPSEIGGDTSLVGVPHAWISTGLRKHVLQLSLHSKWNIRNLTVFVRGVASAIIYLDSQISHGNTKIEKESIYAKKSAQEIVQCVQREQHNQLHYRGKALTFPSLDEADEDDDDAMSNNLLLYPQEKMKFHIGETFAEEESKCHSDLIVIHLIALPFVDFVMLEGLQIKAITVG
jgi:hypothetical protein